MASHTGGWIPGAPVRFGGLHFIVNMEGGLEWICAPVRPTNAISADPIVEALRGLQFDALETHALGSGKHQGPDRGSTEHQLGAFLGSRPAQEDLRHVLTARKSSINTGQQPHLVPGG